MWASILSSLWRWVLITPFVLGASSSAWGTGVGVSCFFENKLLKSPMLSSSLSCVVVPLFLIIHFIIHHCNRLGVVGSGFPVLFGFGQLPTAQACRRFSRPAARRPVRIKPLHKLVKQYRNAHRCNPSTVYRGFGPSHRPWTAWPF